MGDPNPKTTAVPSSVVDSLDEIRAGLRARDLELPSPPAVAESEALTPAAIAARALTAQAVAMSRATATMLSGSRRTLSPALVVIGTRVAGAVTWSLSRAVPLGTRLWAVTTDAARAGARDLGRRVAERPAVTIPPRPEPAEPRRTDVELGSPLELLHKAEQRLAAAEKTLGYDHPSVAAELQLIGAFHHERANYTDALAFYEAALAIQRRTLGPGHPAVAATAADVVAARRDELDSHEADRRARRDRAGLGSPSPSV